MTDTQSAWERNAEQEAQALAKLLATEGRAVMVIVIAAHDDQVGTTDLLHAFAGQGTGANLRQFIAATERKLKWLRDKLYRRA